MTVRKWLRQGVKDAAVRLAAPFSHGLEQSEAMRAWSRLRGCCPRLCPRLRDRFEGRKGPEGRPDGHSRVMRVVHVVSPRSGFRCWGLGAALATDRARGRGPGARERHRPSSKARRAALRSGGPPPAQPGQFAGRSWSHPTAGAGEWDANGPPGKRGHTIGSARSHGPGREQCCAKAPQGGSG